MVLSGTGIERQSSFLRDRSWKNGRGTLSFRRGGGTRHAPCARPPSDMINDKKEVLAPRPRHFARAAGQVLDYCCSSPDRLNLVLIYGNR